jgi:hypothetical protein
MKKNIFKINWTFAVCIIFIKIDVIRVYLYIHILKTFIRLEIEIILKTPFHYV